MTSESEQTTCCIVGGGPAGMVLGYLLARNGVAVTVLESHQDFDREFRGDTLHPGVMELLDSLGFAEELLSLPHTKVHELTLQSQTDAVRVVNFRLLKSKFPYITLIPQSVFLEFIAEKAGALPHFTLKMSSPMTELILEDGRCRGVVYQDAQKTTRELRADLTVAADGRFSRVRKKTELELVKSSPPMDVLWLKLPRCADDDVEFGFRVGQGHLIIVLDREEYFQIGFVIAKGGYHHLKEQGMQTFKEHLATSLPELSDRLQELSDWKAVSVLNVEAGRLREWFLPGLLLIGDAAHVMSPVGGVGINYAIQDAVVAANLLSVPLREETLTENDLKRVQKKRQLPTRFIQAFQRQIQKRIVSPALDSTKPFHLPVFLKWPIIRTLAAKTLGYGVRRVKVDLSLKHDP